MMALPALLNAVQVVGLLSCFALLATSRIGASVSSTPPYTITIAAVVAA